MIWLQAGVLEISLARKSKYIPKRANVWNRKERKEWNFVGE